MKNQTIHAPKLIQLREAIDKIILEYGGDVKWNGWDDGSIIVYSRDGQIFIESEEEET